MPRTAGAPGFRRGGRGGQSAPAATAAATAGSVHRRLLKTDPTGAIKSRETAGLSSSASSSSCSVCSWGGTFEDTACEGRGYGLGQGDRTPLPSSTPHPHLPPSSPGPSEGEEPQCQTPQRQAFRHPKHTRSKPRHEGELVSSYTGRS